MHRQPLIAGLAKLDVKFPAWVNKINCKGNYSSLSTTSNMDHQLLSQKVRQKISVMKTNTGVFKTKRELKCQNELFL